jgi:hypothetical protein
MEITMRTKTLLIIGLVVGATVQAAAASTHRPTRTRGFPAMSEKLRNSNAYVVRGFANNYAAPDTASSYSGGIDEWESTRDATSGMYRDNDLNVYRDGQPRDDINPHGG